MELKIQFPCQPFVKCSLDAFGLASLLHSRDTNISIIIESTIYWTTLFHPENDSIID
jgi:hypothetical protein